MTTREATDTEVAGPSKFLADLFGIVIVGLLFGIGTGSIWIGLGSSLVYLELSQISDKVELVAREIAALKRDMGKEEGK